MVDVGSVELIPLDKCLSTERIDAYQVNELIEAIFLNE